MNRYEAFYPMYDWDDCDKCRKRRHCLPACRPEPPCRPDKDCRPEPAFRMQLFDRCERCCDDRHLPPAAPPVTIVNPWNCCEKAVVVLSVDECGNLVVRIKR